MTQTTVDEAPAADDPAAPAALKRWWSVMDLRIGIVPLPVAVVILGIAAVYVRIGQAPADILMNIAVLATGGFLCGEIGKRIPVLRHLGLAAILATFVPSYLKSAHLLPQPIVNSITGFTDTSNFLPLFIA